MTRMVCLSKFTYANREMKPDEEFDTEDAKHDIVLEVKGWARKLDESDNGELVTKAERPAELSGHRGLPPQTEPKAEKRDRYLRRDMRAKE